MSFEHPWLVWGALTALIPVAIHLINRQRAPVVRFAALEHLLLSDKRLSQSLKVRQLLVLLLRMALLGFLALALAKPSWDEEVSATQGMLGPGAVAIIIDDSLSMNARPGEGDETLLERAIQRAEERIASGGPSTSFALITAGREARLLTPAATFDREALTRALRGVQPGARGADLLAALREAERVLAETGQEERRVVVISDHASHAWRDIEEVWALGDPPEVERVDVRDGQEIANLAITGVEVRSSPELGPEHLSIRVSVSNYGKVATSSKLSVHLGQSKVTSSITLDADSNQDVSLTLKRPPGEAPPGRAFLEDDALEDDNLWTFGIGDGEALHVGLVNGAPHDVATLDEAFFLRAALDTPGPGAPIRTTMLDVGQLEDKRLAHIDVLILANTGALSPASLAAVRGFLERGGGLLTSAGDRLTPEAGQRLDGLLPIPLRGHKAVADPRDPNAALSALRISDFDLEHPVTALFATVDDVSLLKAKTYKVALLEPSGRRAKVLASFTGGLPALVEAKVGQGRSILLTTTVDQDWSDLALRTSFVPLIHQLMEYLAQRGNGKGGAQVTIGREVNVPLPEGRGSLVLTRPDGAEVFVESPDAEDEGALKRIALSDIDLPGRYTLRRRSGGQQSVRFNAHPEGAESDLSPADSERLDALLTSGKDLAQGPVKARDQGSAQELRKTPLWPYLLIALFALLASETWFVLRQ